jgi:putative peptide zinc metalloprotease protein
MIVYAMATWIYRVILFAGISLMVYVLFFKTLGAFLLVTTLTTLIGLPVLSELKEWWRMRKTILSRRRSAISALVVMSLFAGLAIPLPRSVRAPGVLELATQFEIYPPMSGQLESVHASEGESVAEGDVLMEFVSPELDAELEMAVERIALLRARLDRSASVTVERAMSRVLAQQLKAEEERVAGLKRSLARLQIVAPFDGVIAQLPPAVTAGLWVSRETQLGLVIQPGAVRVRGYLSEDTAALVAPGAKGVFVADDPAVRKVEVELEIVLNIAAESIDPPSLSAAQGGTIPVEVGDDAGRPAGAWYAFDASAQATDPYDTALRGIAVFGGDRESLLNRALHQIAKVLVREFGV